MQSTDLVIVISKVLIKVQGSTTVVDPSRFAYIEFFRNATIIQQLLGGNAVITMAIGSIPPVRLPNISWEVAATATATTMATTDRCLQSQFRR